MHEIAPRSTLYGLTPREFEIIREICEGGTNAELGKKLDISEETVKRHISNVFDKTGCGTRLELALFAIAKGLVSQNLEGGIDVLPFDLRTVAGYMAEIQERMTAIQNILGSRLTVFMGTAPTR